MNVRPGDVQPITKEEQARRVWTCPKNTPDCTRKAPCKSCLGRRNRRKGAAKQRNARKALGIPSAKFAARNGHEENWGGAVRVEVKAGASAKPIDTFYRRCAKQSDAAKRVGDLREFVAVAMPDGLSYGYVVVRTDRFLQVIADYFAGENL